jgi:hypothetical protein
MGTTPPVCSLNVSLPTRLFSPTRAPRADPACMHSYKNRFKEIHMNLSAVFL